MNQTRMLLLLLSTLLPTVQSAQTSHPRAQRIGMPNTERALPVCEPKYFVRLFNCDDGCTARLNDGPSNSNEFFKAGFGEDSGWIDITSVVRAGENKITFAVNNQGGAIAYGFQLRKNETMLVNESCGRVGVVGCENNRRYPVGVAREFSRPFEGFRPVSSAEMDRAKSEWPSFIATFRASVNKRDLTALRGMIACPFLSQEGEFNSPNEALRYIQRGSVGRATEGSSQPRRWTYFHRYQRETRAMHQRDFLFRVWK